MLSPEYITAHIQNGLVVDLHQGAISSHNIYSNNETVEQNASSLEMSSEQHFISSNESVPIPMESIQQSLQSSHSSMQPSEHLSHRNHFEVGSSVNDERKIIIGEQSRQYILTNEAPVIVSNKVNCVFLLILDQWPFQI